MCRKTKYLDPGQQFNRWIIVKYSRTRRSGIHNKKFYLCRCECGNTKMVDEATLKNGRSKSCGCWKREVDIARHYVHGQSYNRIYSVWKNMNKRCSDPRHKGYKYYGGKGVEVCNEWKLSFVAFYEWAKKHGYSDALFIDRIDGNGNYEPSNCRFVDWSVQLANRSNTINKNEKQIFKGTQPSCG